MKIFSLLLSLVASALLNLVFHSSASAQEDIDLSRLQSSTSTSTTVATETSANSQSNREAATAGCQVDRINSLLSQNERTGFGGDATGGAEAQNFSEVTTTADSGEGSLRQALSQEGPVWITFSKKIYGETISLSTPLNIESSGVTIDGRGEGGEMANITISSTQENSSSILNLEGGNTIVHGITIAGSGSTNGLDITGGEDYWLDHITFKNLGAGEGISIGTNAETGAGAAANFISLSNLKAENTPNSVQVSSSTSGETLLSVFNSSLSSVKVGAGSRTHLFNNHFQNFQSEALISTAGSLIVAENNLISGKGDQLVTKESGTILSIGNEFTEGAKDFGSISPAEEEPFDISYPFNLLASGKVASHLNENAGAENASGSLEVCSQQTTKSGGFGSTGATFDFNSIKGGANLDDAIATDQESFDLIFSATEQINSTNALITFGFTQPANAMLVWGPENGTLSNAPSPEQNKSTHTISLSPLQPGQSYVYRIEGRNNSGDQVRSRKFSFTTGQAGQQGQDTTPETLRGESSAGFQNAPQVTFGDDMPESFESEATQLSSSTNTGSETARNDFTFSDENGFEPTLPSANGNEGSSNTATAGFSDSGAGTSFSASSEFSEENLEIAGGDSQFGFSATTGSSALSGLPPAAGTANGSVSGIAGTGPIRLAFPGAEGFGNQAAGGRGGQVVYVDNLKDDGGGSLREALETTGARTIIFRTAGTISLDSTLEITQPFLTIAGQTAPGGGILLRHNENSDFEGALIRVDTNDVIVRHIRLRRGATEDSSCCGKNIEFGSAAENVIIDHVSMSWTRGDQIALESGKNITIQNSIIAESLPVMEKPINPNREEETTEEELPEAELPVEGLQENGADSLTRSLPTAPEGVSLIRNLFAQSENQNPELLANQSGAAQLINNLVFNSCGIARIGGATSSSETISAVEPTEEGQVAISGSQPQPASSAGASFDIFGNVDLTGCTTGAKSLMIENGARTQLQGNVLDGEAQGGSNEAPGATAGAAPFSYIPTSELEEKLLATVGATLPKRDAVDTRLIEGIRLDLTKAITDPEEVGGFPELEGESAYLDTDRDGMPDDWEITTGLNPESDADANLDPDNDGYTNLEEFLNGTLPDSAALPGETPVVVEETVDPDIQSTLGLEISEEEQTENLEGEEDSSSEQNETSSSEETETTTNEDSPPEGATQLQGGNS